MLTEAEERARDDMLAYIGRLEARIAEMEQENFELYAKSVSMFHLIPDDAIAGDIREKYEQFKAQTARIAELSAALKTYGGHVEVTVVKCEKPVDVEYDSTQEDSK